MKIWWFKRLKDDKYIEFTNEATAGRLFKDRDFSRKYEYIGWSDGKAFEQEMQGHAVKYDPSATNEELAELQNRPDIKKKRGVLIKKARIAEMQAAKANPDKARPVYDPVFVSGNGHDRTEIRQMLKGKGI